MKELIIRYPNGVMTLNIDNFFPCKIQDERKIFPLIHRWVPEEEQNLLWDSLSDMYGNYSYFAKEVSFEMETAKREGNMTRYRKSKREYSKYEALRKRCKRNIELLIGGMD